MKTFIKKVTQCAVLALALFIGGDVFAASFDPQPMGNNGFTTINSCEHAGCANVKNSISYDDLGSDKEFTVFINFRNSSNGTIHSATGSVNQSGSGSTRTFTGRLSATNASQITDTASITGLPSGATIQFIGGQVYVDDRVGSSGTLCSSLPGLGHIPWENNVSNPSNVYIGDLSYAPHSGWCEQGYIEAHYKVIVPQQQVNGICKIYNGTYSSQPAYDTTTGCQAGNYHDISDTPSEWRWQCQGQHGGSTATCTAARTQQQQPIHGMCGSAHGGTFSTPPSSGLCNAGIATSVQTNQSTYTWSCLGQHGGSDVGCLAHRTQQATYSWVWSEWGQCINGWQTRDVWCQNNQTGQQVPDSHCLFGGAGQKPSTSQQCTISNDLSVMTQNPSNIGNNGARLHGRITSGQANYVFFVHGTIPGNVSCNNPINQRLFPADHLNLRHAGDAFLYNLSGLQQGVQYHYRACAQYNGGIIASGDLVSFQTGSHQSTDHPHATTQSEQNVSETSARLRGSVDMNDYDNGTVFFVWGRNQNQILDVSSYNRYSDIPENGQNLQKQISQSYFNGSDSFAMNVSGLNTNQRYYFRICVEYYAEGDRITCGNSREFRTSRDGGTNSDNVEVRTDAPQNVTQNTATLCGTLVQDGGSSQRTWIEFRTSSGNWLSTPTHQRNAGSWCQQVSNLSSDTSYVYRACTNHGCGNQRNFRTLGSIQTGIPPIIITNDPTNIISNNATLSGTYVTNANSGTCWFEYGRTSALGNQTRTYGVGAGYGTCTHNFTNLAVGTQYCVRAVINTVNGTDRGAIKCFTTLPRVVTPGTSQPPIVVIEQDRTDIDLASLGLGLSLIRLDIDDHQDMVFRNSQVTYEVRWENISMIDLDDIDIKVSLPQEIQVTNITRGRYDINQHAVYYNISELDARESGEMFISGVVGRGTVGNLVTAEAEAAYDNPINRAQENAKDFDINEYGVQIAGVTASVFGLANVTFLGWLVILLGLFIIFLVARYLYLEREELRAQSYIHGGYTARPYVAPAPQDDYEPYRPNRQ